MVMITESDDGDGGDDDNYDNSSDNDGDWECWWQWCTCQNMTIAAPTLPFTEEPWVNSEKESGT